jgi:hypothetical protein
MAYIRNGLFMSMKKLNLLLLGMLPLFFQPSKAQDITSDLETWYKFDYQPGDTHVKDYSGNNRHIAPVKWGQQQPFNTNLQWETATIAGLQQSVVHFPAGRDENVILSNTAGNTWLGISGSQARTLCSWVKIDAGANDFAGQILFAYGDDSKAGGRFEIDLKGRAIEFENAANNAGNNWNNRNVFSMNDTDYPQGQWFHLALVFDGTGNRKTGISLYLNGKKVLFPSITDASDLSINSFLQYAPEIGTYMSRMSVADMRMYSRALTATDIRLLCPDTNIPVDPFTISNLNNIIKTAIINGDSQVTVPPGTYRGNTSEGVFIYLKDVNDFKIIADGVTMVCEKKTRALQLENCKNVTLQGLTIDYDPLTFTQGDIVATGAGFVDVKIHAGYDVRNYSRIDIIDPVTRYRKRGSTFLWGATAKIISDSIVRVSQSTLPGIAVAGDMATMSTGNEGGAPHALELTKCRGGMVLKNVSVYSGPGFGILEFGGEGGTHLDACKIIPGPTPAGAVQARLLSVSWDALQHKLTRVGPLVENCQVRDAGDDSWSVTWDGEFTIGSVDGNMITIAKEGLEIGDSLRSSLTSDVVYIVAKTAGVIQLNKACPWPVGTRLYSPDRRCENFILRNNHFHSTGRVLVKAGNGLIENNVFEQTHSGVSVNTEIAPGATGISNLIIRSNKITGTGHFMPDWNSNQAGAISIADGGNRTLSPAGAFDNILVEKNTIEDVSGVNVVVSSARNVMIRENIIKRTGLTTPNSTGGAYNISQNTVVYLANSSNVTLDSNEVIDQGLASLKELLNVSGLTETRGGIFIRDNGQLPVMLASFKVSKSSEKNLENASIAWTTTAETNSESFEIQHSVNGKTWKVIGSVRAIGESTDVQKYSFTHTKAAQGQNYYRLKMKDVDGTFTYSEIQSVRFGGQSFILRPNPVSDRLVIDADLDNISKIKVLSAGGKTMYVSDNLTEKLIDVRKFPSGVYNVTITDKEGIVRSQKFAVVH